jgi:hypothetical protein
MGNFCIALIREYGNTRNWINAGLTRLGMNWVAVFGIGMKNASYECVIKEFGFLARRAIRNSAAGGS